MNFQLASITDYFSDLLGASADDVPEIMPGDYVEYWCDDTQQYHVGVYLDLWYYISDERETSPYPACDGTRYDAKIESISEFGHGCTYANIDTITKISEREYFRRAYAHIETVIV